MTTEEGHKLWYSGEESKHQDGVVFLVNKNIVNAVVSCTPISNRLISIRISAKHQDIKIIQVYTPTSDYNNDVIEAFYEELENTIMKSTRKDFLIGQGD